MASEATSQELATLELLVKEHPQWQLAVQNLEHFFKEKKESDTVEAEEAYFLHQRYMEELGIGFEENTTAVFIPKNNNRTKKIWLSALTVLCMAIAIISLREFSRSKKTTPLAEVYEVAVRNGATTRLQLPDGSTVVLNAGSKLIYGKDFGTQNREVQLTGEGYFDVKKMPAKPFIIHTADMDIKVIGTAFNVKSYPDDKTTETSLFRGSIEVTLKKRPQDKFRLSPNEKLIVKKETATATTNATVYENKNILAAPSEIASINIKKLVHSPTDNSIVETQWIENKLVFTDEPFEEIANKMQRRYNVVVEIRNPQIKQERFTGSFEKETIEQALEALRFSVPFSFHKKGNTIIINE